MDAVYTVGRVLVDWPNVDSRFTEVTTGHEPHDACQSRVVAAFVDLGFDLFELDDVKS